MQKFSVQPRRLVVVVVVMGSVGKKETVLSRGYQFHWKYVTFCKYSFLPKAYPRAGIQTRHTGGESGPSNTPGCALSSDSEQIPS